MHQDVIQNCSNFWPKFGHKSLKKVPKFDFEIQLNYYIFRTKFLFKEFFTNENYAPYRKFKIIRG